MKAYLFHGRFIAFGWESQFAMGGMEDALGSFDTLNEVMAREGVRHVLDRETGDVIDA